MMGAIEIQTYLSQNGIGSPVDLCIPVSVNDKEMASVFLKYLDNLSGEVNAAVAVDAVMLHA